LLTVTVPNVAVPFLKTTDPVAVPPNCGDTVAVKVTLVPGAEGFCDEISPVVVGSFPITWLMLGEVLEVKFASPA
jgi:hypothetical protein